MSKSPYKVGEGGVQGYRLPIQVIHPVTHAAIPVFVSNYVLADYGDGAVMGVPKHDARDRAFAALFDLPQVPVIDEQKRRLFIGVPGHGIVVSVPIKSIGGGKTVAFLGGSQQPAKYTPELTYSYELIVAIANEGRTDLVMNAARSAGAAGGTVLHGKGTGSDKAEKFYSVSIAQEKEVILIVAKTEQKAGIMRAILEKAGPNTEAGTIVFSLPTSEVAGFGLL